MKSFELLSQNVGERLLGQQQILTTAESCTGGGIATAITAISGSSAWFDRAFVTYSNEAKLEMLNVQAATLELHGAVSEPVVQEMALGALLHSRATLSVSVSGIAGPTGGSAEKPVGTVCFGWADNQKWLKTETMYFSGSREAIRHQAIEHALQGVLARLESK